MAAGFLVMDKNVAAVVLVVVMAIIIVGLDFAFLRGNFWLRLIVNAGIVLVAGTIYWHFLK